LNSRMNKTTVCALVSLLILTAACTPERDESTLFSPEGINMLVVESVLIVDEPHPPLKLSRTQIPNAPYDVENAAVSGASITITSGGVPMPYFEMEDFPGVYQPDTHAPLILAETEYLLRVETLEGELLTAHTLTPAPIEVDSWVLLDPSGTTELRELQTFADAGDSVYFKPENQIIYAEGLVEARFNSGGAATYGGFGYQLSLSSLDLDSDFVIDPPFFDDEDFESLGRRGASPVLAGDDGQLRLPWFGIYFEGRHLYRIYVLDNNWYDLVRSTPESDGALGFGGNVGDSFANPIFNIDGGIGLFGSAATDAVGFYIHPQP
jgi:Domain of unknown function (DUF4249)